MDKISFFLLSFIAADMNLYCDAVTVKSWGRVRWKMNSLLVFLRNRVEKLSSFFFSLSILQGSISIYHICNSKGLSDEPKRHLQKWHYKYEITFLLLTDQLLWNILKEIRKMNKCLVSEGLVLHSQIVIDLVTSLKLNISENLSFLCFGVRRLH